MMIPLSDLFNISKERKALSVDNRTLFVRLVAVAERLVTLESAFDFELTQQPASLFTPNGQMRKSSKSALMKNYCLKIA